MEKEKETDTEDCEQDLARMDSDYDVPRPAQDELPTDREKAQDSIYAEIRRRYYEMGGV